MAFPIEVKNFNSPDFGLLDLSSLFASVSAQTETTVGGGGVVYTRKLRAIVPAGFHSNSAIVKVVSDQPCKLRLFVYSVFGEGLLKAYLNEFDTVNANETAVFNLRDIKLTELTKIEVWYSSISGGTAPTLVASGSMNAKLGGINPLAKNKIHVFGDSVTYTTGGNTAIPYYAGQPAFGCEYFPALIKQWYTSNGKDVDTNYSSFGGAHTPNMLALLRTSNTPNFDLAIISLGLNDASTGTSPTINTALYTANIAEMIGILKARNPNKTILLCAPSPTKASNRSTIGTYRTALQNLFTGTYGGTMSNVGGGTNGFSTSQKIIYVDMSTAFTSTDASYYAGDDLHPNVSLGHPAIKNIITPVLSACPWTIMQ